MWKQHIHYKENVDLISELLFQPKGDLISELSESYLGPNTFHECSTNALYFNANESESSFPSFMSSFSVV